MAGEKQDEQSYKSKQIAMGKDIEHIKDTIDSIETYIKEDRDWKKKLKQDLNENYTRQTETNRIRKVLYTSIGVAITVILGILGTLTKVVFFS